MPGFSSGQHSADLAALNFFFLDQSYDYESLQHTLRLMAQPTEMFGADSGSGLWDIETTGVEARIAFAFSPELTVTAGWSNERRDTVIETDVESELHTEREEQERDGFFARLVYSPSARVELAVGYRW